MTDQAKTEMSSKEGHRGTTCSRLRKWWQSSQLFKQDLGLPPLLEPRDTRWLHADWLQRSLAACYWAGFFPVPLSVPQIAGQLHQQSQWLTKWRMSMDVFHFSPAEISLSTRDDFLEVKGGHKERPDKHGFIARCFTWRYRLPVDVDASKITGTLHADGILTVEAPLLDDSVPAATIIPIKVMTDGTTKQQVEQQGGEVHQREPGSYEELNNADIQPSTGHREEAPPEVCSDRGPYGINRAGQKHEEEEEEEKEKKEEEGLGRQAVEEEEVQGIAGSGQIVEAISPPEEQEWEQQERGQGQEQQQQDQEQLQEQEKQQEQEAAHTEQQRNQ